MRRTASDGGGCTGCLDGIVGCCGDFVFDDDFVDFVVVVDGFGKKISRTMRKCLNCSTTAGRDSWWSRRNSLHLNLLHFHCHLILLRLPWNSVQGGCYYYYDYYDYYDCYSWNATRRTSTGNGVQTSLNSVDCCSQTFVAAVAVVVEPEALAWNYGAITEWHLLLMLQLQRPQRPEERAAVVR